MQPTDEHPKRSGRQLSSFSVFIDQPTPRQRNRIHNQVVKRAIANIGRRRDQFVTAYSHVDFPDTQDPNRWRSGQSEIVDEYDATGAVVLSPRSTVTAGGLRGDPFRSFPIRADGCVPSAVDYFLQHYAPVHLNPKKEDLGPADSLPLSRRYFSLALENAPMFELMVTLAEASHSARLGKGRKPTRDVLIHYGHGLRALRLNMERSAAPDDDATILTVLLLLGIALIYNDFAAFETHLTGLRQLVEMRGGVDNLGWDGFLKTSIVSLESLWAYHENKKLNIAPTEAKIKLEYPRHPFPPDLCALIAKLPEGFGELSLVGVFSFQMIKILSRMSEWINQLQHGRQEGALRLGDPDGTYFKQAHSCLELIGLPSLSLLEKILCCALVACALETYNKKPQQNPVHRRLLESLTEMLNRYNLDPLDKECSMWMALVIAGPSSLPKEDGADYDRLAYSRNILLDQMIEKSVSSRNWEWVKHSVQKFFWDQQLLERWHDTWELRLMRYLTIKKSKRQEQS
ncbi:uncharacterized protein Z518_04269 [Rhinocladiella mackenziei CBS 650.93]|uniref:Uncharacterized protein n=1 Tax=Rhinocladiella mackenziei CBS 650.93 TaxID=1442369 RepID=A0A0D2IKQ4_9EURO|nr:uncharacterized protein Z518_04269 [Rhinocladiella mackenziei CBS 650.93]KIX06294.1 hypothetical protein Z518_04269 [Rhinocladiella mackenziei CBS 650.93]